MMAGEQRRLEEVAGLVPNLAAMLVGRISAEKFDAILAQWSLLTLSLLRANLGPGACQEDELLARCESMCPDDADNRAWFEAVLTVTADQLMRNRPGSSLILHPSSFAVPGGQ